MKGEAVALSDFQALDREFWAAVTNGRPLNVEVAAVDTWQLWASQLRTEIVGYWHGYTGRITERLDVSDDEWLAALDSQKPGWREVTKIGDSVFDPFWQLCRDAGLVGKGTWPKRLAAQTRQLYAMPEGWTWVNESLTNPAPLNS